VGGVDRLVAVGEIGAGQAIAFGLGPSGVSLEDSLWILATPGALLLPGT
jgi:hypothetical protein